MPILTNSRRERFAQGLAQGKTADEAYKLAGYKANNGNCIRMKGNESIQKRVTELQDQAVAKFILTKEWVVERLIENANRAMEVHDGSVANGAVANRALELLGKELGMFIERAENRNIEVKQTFAVSPELPTMEEWEAEFGTPRTLDS